MSNANVDAFVEDVKRRLSALTDDLARDGVRKIWLFGSHARGDANEDSDIDLLVDGVKATDLYISSGWVESIRSAFAPGKADVVLESMLHDNVRGNVAGDKILLFDLSGHNERCHVR